MDTSLFKNYLISSGFSALTVKNYLADVNRFIRYFTSVYSIDFKPGLTTHKMIKDYQLKLSQEIGQRSVERHLSSLRRYFQFLQAEGHIQNNPFSLENTPAASSLESLSKLKSFKDYLYSAKASDLTIKNYIIDVRQFLFWLSLALDEKGEEIELPAKEVIKRLIPDALHIYKERLVSQSDLSVASINRKLSSLRTYLRWASKNGVTDVLVDGPYQTSFSAISNVKADDPLAGLYDLQDIADEPENPRPSNYSNFPPFRLAQKIALILTLSLDFLLIAPLADILSACQYLIWKASGQKLFEPKEASKNIIVRSDPLAQIKNLKRNNFSSRLLTPMEMAFHRKFAYYLIHVRPVWYRKYKSYKLVRTLHTGVMMASIALAVMIINNELILPKDNGRILGERVVSSGRVLSFKGSLADEKGNPIKDASLRFSIYTNPQGPANKLWQEERKITPDPTTGEFIVALGESNKIPDYVFTQGKRLYIGVSVNNEAELMPRQPVPNIALAEDSQTLQGLLPIVHPDAGSENVILALDSSGNLTLGGNKSHTFQTLGGSFQIKGQSIVLATLPGSSGSIILNPDGQGMVDINKPLQNTSEEIIGDGPLGSLLVKDSLAVNSEANGPALYISHSGIGPLITASSSGQIRFNVDDIGSTTIGHNLTIGGTDIASTRSVFNLLNRNVAIINFAGESEAVTIGSSSGTTTIRNARTSLSGDLTIMGQSGISLFGESSGINFSGSGSHVLTASSGNLILGSSLSLAENTDIVPGTTSGTNNLGSTSNPFDTVYSENFIIPSKMLLNSEKFGFGTSLPGYQFHVQLGKSDDAIAMFENTDTSLNADVLKLKVSTITPSTNNKYINFLDGSNNSLGSIQASASGGISYLTTGSDFAEYFRKENQNEFMAAGDVVCLGSTGGVTKCNTQTNTNTIIGVITDRAGFVGASDKANDPNFVLVGLHGQVRVRIKASERILPGDTLTVSNLNGIAQRASKPGQMVGRALSASDGNTSVLAYILPAWHDPNTLMDNTGNLTIVQAETEDQDTKSYFVIDTSTNEVLGSIGIFSEAVTASLKTGLLEASDVIVNNSISIGGTLIAGAVKAKDISTETLTASEHLFAKAVNAESIGTERIVAPIVESEKITVSILSPVSDDSLTLHLKNKRIEFVAQDKPVASFDDQGNASLSGKLSASSVETKSIEANEASIAATLRAKEIITENLNLSDEGFERLVAKIGTDYADSLAALIQSGASSDDLEQIVNPLLPEEDNQASSPLASSLTLSEINTLASPSSSMPSLAQADLNIGQLNVHTGLMVYGVTSLAQAAVADLLTVGSSLIIQNNSVNTLGTALELQPLKQGNISLMAGKIIIDTEGNATFSEDLTVKKTLFAKEIKPLEENLNVRLDENKKINIGSQEKSLTIDSKGDISSSGSASFMDLLTNSFSIVRGAQADTSSTETEASSSAGTATIRKGEIERTIISPFVTPDSLIYLSPASKTFGTTPYVARQTVPVPPSRTLPSGKTGSFTIRIQEQASEDIKVNWWIIN